MDEKEISARARYYEACRLANVRPGTPEDYALRNTLLRECGEPEQTWEEYLRPIIEADKTVLHMLTRR